MLQVNFLIFIRLKSIASFAPASSGNPMKRTATLADVAALAGVTKMTTSCAFRSAKNVSTHSQAKMQAMAQLLGYVGNPLATPPSCERTDLIGVVLPSLRKIVISEVLSGSAAGF